MSTTPTSPAVNNINTNTGTSSGRGELSTFSNPASRLIDAKVDSQLRLQIPALSGENLINGTKLTPQLAQQLHNQPVLIVQQQQLSQIFGQNMILSSQLKLPAQLSNLTRQWLKQEPSIKSIPKELVVFLKEQLGINFEGNPNRLIRLHLQQLLTVQYLSQEPILEISSKQHQQLNQDKLQNLIQFILPIPLQDKATLVVKQDTQRGKKQVSLAEGIIQFEMMFDLKHFGHLKVLVDLTGFNLKTQCFCSSLSLFDKTQKYWPQLQQRFEKLGFSCNNSIEIQVPHKSDKLTNHKGLINLKV